MVDPCAAASGVLVEGLDESSECVGAVVDEGLDDVLLLLGGEGVEWAVLLFEVLDELGEGVGDVVCGGGADGDVDHCCVILFLSLGSVSRQLAMLM